MPQINSDKERKQFYSISEVARIVGVNETALRFWEKEFKEISPRRSGRGIRFYSNDDLDTIKLIHYLVKDKGLTLEGARKRLKENRGKEASAMDVLQRLQDIRRELLAIRNNIELIEAREEVPAKAGKGRNPGKEAILPSDTKKEDDASHPTLTLF